jgi:hypothetical protein
VADTQSGIEGQPAEYATLRQEMESRAAVQDQLFTAQFAIAGAVFSFSLSAFVLRWHASGRRGAGTLRTLVRAFAAHHDEPHVVRAGVGTAAQTRSSMH